jgi:hypothetical protein
MLGTTRMKSDLFEPDNILFGFGQLRTKAIWRLMRDSDSLHAQNTDYVTFSTEVSPGLEGNRPRFCVQVSSSAFVLLLVKFQI